jgi:hypothetical protein
MSSAIDPLTLDAHLAPRRTPTLTSASIALRTAQQAQFQSINSTTAIFTAPGGNVLRVQCRPANVMGKVDTMSPVTIRVRSATARTISKPAFAAIGTLLSAVLDPDGSDLIAVVLPGADGVVDLSVVFDAPDATSRVTLQHRHYAATDAIPVV